MSRAVDYAPLTSDVTRADVRALKQAQGSGSGVAPAVLLAVVGGIIAVIAFVAAGGVGVLAGQSSPSRLLPVGIVVLIGAGIAAGGVLGSQGRWRDFVRLDRFARANGLVFRASDPAPAYSGAIFGRGGSRTVSPHLMAASGRFTEIGNYEYTTGSGKNRRTHRWGFAVVRLDRRLPHMVLDSRANNSFLGTNLPVAFDRDQVLSLEGDFDRHFTLYCPREYETDALYVFTPDLMALLIDEASPFDVEIVDDWMFVYSTNPFVLTQPAVWDRLLRIVDLVGVKMVQRTERYRDERVAPTTAASALAGALPDVVAPQGRRLRRGFPVAAVVIVVIVVVGWIALSSGLLR
ncbi:hypothetical protein [Schumannella sp. 10F1B-5-1]|uniref:hypothetical protein n=1 Tax=Schumannella sp. 10F1B-5-1 TaxID=2590780 RepID=UPI001131D022|nr:hypothetical protein [Schumannella sp. 10F1B-5-1]TPW70784.1 hypothetical protein FJ658_11695 [Schumannella sp. 10F1B-5-1]